MVTIKVGDPQYGVPDNEMTPASIDSPEKELTKGPTKADWHKIMDNYKKKGVVYKPSEFAPLPKVKRKK